MTDLKAKQVFSLLTIVFLLLAILAGTTGKVSWDGLCFFLMACASFLLSLWLAPEIEEDEDYEGE